MTVGRGVGTPQNNGSYGCPHLVLENQCLGTGTKCCCVQILSTWYVTVYIITVFIRLTALGAY